RISCADFGLAASSASGACAAAPVANRASSNAVDSRRGFGTVWLQDGDRPIVAAAVAAGQPDDPGGADQAVMLSRAACRAMKSRTCGYTCRRQRRPLKMP